MALSFPVSPSTLSPCLSSDYHSFAVVSAPSILSYDSHYFPQTSQRIERFYLRGNSTFVSFSLDASIPGSTVVNSRRPLLNVKKRIIRSKARGRKPILLPSAYLNFGQITSLGRHGMPVHPFSGFSCRSTVHLGTSAKPIAPAIVTELQETKTVWLCKCSSGIGGLGSLLAVEWKPVIDQLLLGLSIALAYFAGIVTPETPTFLPSPGVSQDRRKVLRHVDTDLKDFEEKRIPQRDFARQIFLQEEDFWNEARSRLSISIAAADSLGNESFEKSCQLNLQALARGPRLRLLLRALEHLNKEMSNLQCDNDCIKSDWTSKSVEMLCESVVPICCAWVLEEFSKETKDPSKSISGTFAAALGSLMSKEHKSKLKAVKGNLYLRINEAFGSQLERFQGNKIMMSCLSVTGKAEFYAEFFHFLCFASVRPESCCSLQTIMNHKKAILEDVVITMADGAATLYLELISADNFLGEMEWPNVVVPSISSTRMLERFRNEVALHGWINENFQSVTAMFEDRFDLWILKGCNIETCGAQGTQSRRNRKNRVCKSGKRIQHSELIFDHYRIPLRRIKEFRALSGWRYYYSLYLEFSDVMGPLLKTIAIKLGEGISFLLVFLIGRSLGLICRGIRQSIQWNPK